MHGLLSWSIELKEMSGVIIGLVELLIYFPFLFVFSHSEISFLFYTKLQVNLFYIHVW